MNETERPVGGRVGNEDDGISGLSSLPLRPFLAGFLVIATLSAAVFLRFGQLRRFAELASEAEPWWLSVAVAAQVLTYAANGQVWNIATRAVGKRFSARFLVRLSVEKLTVDQLLPSAGVAGHVGVLQALRRAGVSSAVALEAVFLDIISFHIAYAVATAVALAILSFHHDVTSVVLAALGVFAIISVTVPTLAVVLLRRRDLLDMLPAWLTRRSFPARLLSAVSRMTSDNVLAGRNISFSVLFQAIVFVLDGATLWATLHAVGVHTAFGTALAAFVVGAVAGTVSFVPGGIGTFEFAVTTTLIGLGVPFEGALTGVLIFRGLTLWLPLVPGIVMAHRDFGLPFSRRDSS
ncbi:MAG: flippase-like domain-containing protein [Candidatus Moranbacteria bacterium]|nr:flippase-like domain-containing protein [Candidatus Moranbacteria bacterium]